MIKAIALDDEPLALKIIEQFCQQCDDIELVGIFHASDAALQCLKEQKTDLLFLDINMPAISGIDFFRQLEQSPLVIFTTAYSEFAVTGFELNAVDYLLKPFTFERFKQAIQKIRLIQPTREKEKILNIKVGHAWLRVPYENIRYIESLDNYVKIYTKEKIPVLTRTPIKSIENLLPADLFIRVHRSYIVSKNQIEKVEQKRIFLKGNTEIPVSKSHTQQVGKLLGNQKIS